MGELHRIYKKQLIALAVLLIVCALGWSLTSYSTVFAGLALGALCGQFNFRSLIRRMESFDRKLDEGKKVKSLGTITRFASGILAAAVAMTYPQYFHLISAIIGLMIPYVLLLVDRIVFHFKNQ